jgi:hypothetical protein
MLTLILYCTLFMNYELGECVSVSLHLLSRIIDGSMVTTSMVIVKKKIYM